MEHVALCRTNSRHFIHDSWYDYYYFLKINYLPWFMSGDFVAVYRVDNKTKPTNKNCQTQKIGRETE